jgi:hypothetical protein
MRGVFAYAMKIGLILKNPAQGIERRRVVQATMLITSFFYV